MSTPKPEVVRYGLLYCQVCIPEDWPDDQIVAFAEAEFPCGTSAGWQVAKEGSLSLGGDPERNPCSERKGCVHVRLDA